MHNDHQRVIVEHVLNGRQHYHVMWNRVSMNTGKAVWPGEHWKKSKQICREMERELGLKSPRARRINRVTFNGLINSVAFIRGKRQRIIQSNLNLAPPWILLSRQFMHSATLTPDRPQPAQAQFPITGKNASTSGMCEAQRIDFIAACEDKMTWRAYFEKWSSGGPVIG